MMKKMRMRAGVALLAASALALAGCGGAETGGTGDGTSGGGEATGEPIKIGVIVSVTGNFATQAKDFQNGFNAALDYLTDGTMVVDGHPLEIMVGDDTGDPAVGAAKATEFVGEGATILAGPTNSAVALSVADIALQNNALYIGGTSGTSDLVGMGPAIFATSGASPSGTPIVLRQFGVDPKGKKVAYLGQDYAYGQSALKQTQSLLEPAGVEVLPYLLPQETTDFLPLTVQMKQNPAEFMMSSWAGAGQDQLFNALGTQGILKDTTFLGNLLLHEHWGAMADALGDSVENARWLLNYHPGFVDNEKDKFLIEYAEKNNHKLEYDDVVGWHAAEMIVQGIKEGGTDPMAMADAIAGWSFEGPGGQVVIRKEDNQVTVSNNIVKLHKDDAGVWQATLIEHVSAEETIPELLPERKVR